MALLVGARYSPLQCTLNDDARKSAHPDKCAFRHFVPFKPQNFRLFQRMPSVAVVPFRVPQWVSLHECTAADIGDHIALRNDVIEIVICAVNHPLKTSVKTHWVIDCLTETAEDNHDLQCVEVSLSKWTAKWNQCQVVCNHLSVKLWEGVQRYDGFNDQVVQQRVIEKRVIEETRNRTVSGEPPDKWNASDPHTGSPNQGV